MPYSLGFESVTWPVMTGPLLNQLWLWDFSAVTRVASSQPAPDGTKFTTVLCCSCLIGRAVAPERQQAEVHQQSVTVRYAAMQHIGDDSMHSQVKQLH
jgi:hypothetical protein